MDRRERLLDEQEELLRVAFESMQARIWTGIPGVVKQFPAASGLAGMIVDIQPTVNGILRKLDGTFSPLQMPVLLDCPVMWQGGGGVTATFPIKAGDECLVVFSSRCIDAWWKAGFQAAIGGNANPAMNPPDLRMHSLSDGFAFVGVRSLPRSYTVDLANACLITDDGQAYFKLNPTTHAVNILANGGVTINASAGINLNGVTIDSSGNVGSPATVTATTDVVGGGKHLLTHVHSGVSTGSGDSGPPV
jgi:hypothetical protein